MSTNYPTTEGKEQARYGCWNQPRPQQGKTYIAQDGWDEKRNPDGTLTRTPIWIEINGTFGTTDCMYDAAQEDQHCAGCTSMKGNP